MTPMRTVPKALIVWCGILVLAIVNGVLREQTLIPAFGPVGGLVSSACC